MFGKVSYYVTLISLYDFQIDKKLKEKKYMEILEVVDTVAFIAGVVAVVAGAYFAKPVVLSVGLILVPFGAMSWFYTSEYRKLAELDATRNTIEQSAKNVQISVEEMRERREILQTSTDQLLQTHQRIAKDEKKLARADARMCQMALETRNGIQLKGALYKQIEACVDKISRQTKILKPISRSINRDMAILEQATLYEVRQQHERIMALQKRQAAISMIGKTAESIIQLKAAVKILNETHPEEYQRMIYFVPELEAIA